MNRLTVIGNVTRDPEERTTQDGKTVCNFTVAVNRRPKREGQPEADFFRVAAWGKLGENCQKYLAKGRKVAVVGSVSVRAYEGKDGTPQASIEVFAQDVEFLSPAGQGGTEQGSTEQSEASTPAPMPVEIETSELPF